jgi:dTDP-4-dehydrorhamnose 3,5-epimerase
MPFTFYTTPIAGLIVIEPRVFPDERGFFMESYKQSEFEKAGIHAILRAG